MSWDSYINNMVKDKNGTVTLSLAAICGMNPASVWATSPGFDVTVDQIKALCGNPSGFTQKGPTIGPYKCMLLRNNKEVQGMWCLDLKTSADGEGNTYSVCVGFSNTAIIIGIGTKESPGGKVSEAVYNITKYLRDSNM